MSPWESIPRSRSKKVETQNLTINNVGGGIIPELFNKGLSKVLNNISDKSTSPTKPRKITIDISMEPSEELDQVDIHVSMRTTLAPTRGRKALAYLDLDGDEKKITLTDPNQMELAFGLNQGLKKAEGAE
jgi:hypothetical protein